MEYKEESVHNALTVAYNAVVYIVLNADNNILCIMIVPVIALQLDALSNPAANLLPTLLKAPNALVIKQVCIPSGKLKAKKSKSKLAKAWAHQQYQTYLPASFAPWQVWGD